MIEQKDVIFVLLDRFADWEIAFLAPVVNLGMQFKGSEKYRTKILAPTKMPVISIGGLKVIPDYTPDTLPEDYAALVLIGGMSWDKEQAEAITPLVKQAIKKDKPVGGICDAAAFLAKNGFLNNVRHTGNTLQQLEEWAGSSYTNKTNFIENQAVSDNNVITANGTGYLEFAKEILLLLDVAYAEKIEEYYQYFKLGHYEFMKKIGQ